MKAIVGTILLIFFALYSFSKALVVFHFYVYQSYISQNLCENRDKPLRKCCGKCQLRKKLNQEERNKPSFSLQLDESDYISDAQTFTPVYLTPVKNKAYSRYIISTYT
ncbi:MAG TPA: hypothetical protein VFQ58_10435, partial [Flavisolibacter sp.]|nr:hypothetical protein [Flavisolibacter sp.]